MLYLNSKSSTSLNCNWNLTLTSVVFESLGGYKQYISPCDLTLTSVVFESGIGSCKNKFLLNLTLTSVVFELKKVSNMFILGLIFNFNKCCIWMGIAILIKLLQMHLTLTSVVFEFSLNYYLQLNINQ